MGNSWFIVKKKNGEKNDISMKGYAIIKREDCYWNYSLLVMCHCLL